MNQQKRHSSHLEILKAYVRIGWRYSLLKHSLEKHYTIKHYGFSYLFWL